MSTTWLPMVLYPAPESTLPSAMSALPLAWLIYLAVSELRVGEHLVYSKFWHHVVDRKQPPGHRVRGAAAAAGGSDGDSSGVLLSSRKGMLLAYVPALIAAVASFAVPGAVEGLRARILTAALAVYFLKRVLEVLFLHRYSGKMALNAALTISSNYQFNTVVMIYEVDLTRGLPDPKLNLLYPGMFVFVIGIVGNLYHHCLLSQLRTRGKKFFGYKELPEGGLFKLVVVVASGTMLYH